MEEKRRWWPEDTLELLIFLKSKQTKAPLVSTPVILDF